MLKYLHGSFTLSVLLSLFCAIQCIAQAAPGNPLPKPTDGFQPKVTYEVNFASAWQAVTRALTENQIPIETGSQDASQITTAYKLGPTDGGLGGGVFGGKLATQYKYLVFFVRVSSSETKIKVAAVLEARRNAASLGKIFSGNNAVSDTRWIDATSDNPAVVMALQNWLYEQIEREFASLGPAAEERSPGAGRPTPPAGCTASTASEVEKQLEKINELLAKKAITESEYQAMRAKLLCL